MTAAWFVFITFMVAALWVSIAQHKENVDEWRGR